MLKRKKFLIGGLIVLAAIAYLGYGSFRSSATYYYEVGELLVQGNSVYGETVRVNGQVIPGSVEQQNEGLGLRFAIADIDGEESLMVVYQGVVPDTFKAGNNVVVEGRLNSSGTFQGDILMPKCPSRYAPA